MAHISDIKLIRTDTTLYLSQKAEKGMSCSAAQGSPLIAFLWLRSSKASEVGLTELRSAQARCAFFSTRRRCYPGSGGNGLAKAHQ